MAEEKQVETPAADGTPAAAAEKTAKAVDHQKVCVANLNRKKEKK